MQVEIVLTFLQIVLMCGKCKNYKYMTHDEKHADIQKLAQKFQELVQIEKELGEMKSHNKNFTLDGRLIGDFAEAFATTAFDLTSTETKKRL